MTEGFPSRQNNKTVVKFDKFLNDIKENKLFENYTFNLFERLPDGSIVEITYRGAWVMCDNGCLKWPMLKSFRNYIF